MVVLQVKQQQCGTDLTPSNIIIRKGRDQGGLGKATTIPVRPAEDDAHVIGVDR
jgi:hypothetical protein